MTIEATIVATLTGLVAGRVYPDLAPDKPTKPYIVYQQVGGQAVNFLDTATIPSKNNGRFQLSVWAVTRTEAASLAKAVAAALRVVSSLHPTVLGEPVATYDAETKLRGSRQDFSFWFDL